MLILMQKIIIIFPKLSYSRVYKGSIFSVVLGFPLNTFLEKGEKSRVGTVRLDLFCEELLECDMKLSDSLSFIYPYPCTSLKLNQWV